MNDAGIVACLVLREGGLALEHGDTSGAACQ